MFRFSPLKYLDECSNIRKQPFQLVLVRLPKLHKTNLSSLHLKSLKRNLSWSLPKTDQRVGYLRTTSYLSVKTERSEPSHRGEGYKDGKFPVVPWDNPSRLVILVKRRVNHLFKGPLEWENETQKRDSSLLLIQTRNYWEIRRPFLPGVRPDSSELNDSYCTLTEYKR